MRNGPITSDSVRISDLSPAHHHAFALAPDADARAQIAAELGIKAVRKLRFAGRMTPQERDDWRLEADLGATVVQDCVVTLAPVTTRIDEAVTRTYLADPPPVPEGDEIEMPEDDAVEPLPRVLDLRAVMIEALALALPVYPHAEGVTPLRKTYTEPGRAALSDDDVKPFAGLAGLRDKLSGDDGKD